MRKNDSDAGQRECAAAQEPTEGRQGEKQEEMRIQLERMAVEETPGATSWVYTVSESYSRMYSKSQPTAHTALRSIGWA